SEWLGYARSSIELRWQNTGAITGEKHKGHIAGRKRLSNRIDPLASQIHIQHRRIARFVIGRIEGIGEPRNRPNHNTTSQFQHFLDQCRDEVFVFDDQNFNSIKRCCHEGGSSASLVPLPRLSAEPSLRFCGLAGILSLQLRPPLTVSSFASPCNSKRMPRSMSSVPNPGVPHKSIFGPPSSFQVRSRRGGRSPVMLQGTCLLPPGTESAPYFAALVVSS